MSVKERIASQFARPQGLLAPVTARVLNIGNRRINGLAIEALDPKRGERVLEIGFGGGAALGRVLRQVGAGGRVAGLELSTEMVERARRRWRTHVEAGRLAVEEGSVDAMPFEETSFDAVSTVNTVYFWEDVPAALTEVFRVVAPGGRVLIAIQPRVTKQWERLYGREIPDATQLATHLTDVGFEAAELREPTPANTLILGRRPA